MNNVGTMILEALKREKMSQNKAADLAGVKRGTLSKIVNGMSVPRPSTLSRIAVVLGIDPKELLSASAVDIAEARRQSGDDLEYQEYLDELTTKHLPEVDYVIEELRAEARKNPYVSAQLVSLLQMIRRL